MNAKRLLFIGLIVLLAGVARPAEVLIYNGTHWMDKLTAEQLAEYAKKYDNWGEKYAGRWQKGQVVEIRPDGFWGKGPYPRTDVFRVVLLPGVKEADVQKYLDPGTTERRRYRVDTGATKDVETVTGIKTLSVTDKEAVIPERT